MRLWPAIAAVVAFLMVGCGSRYFETNPPVGPPTSALVPWRGFPADQKPRPIVWLNNGSPANGFDSGDAKIAAYCNKYVLGTALPKNIPSQTVATWANGTTASYRGISATAAFAAITVKMDASDCASVQPLVISAVSLGNYDFTTDRGKAQITAWLFTAPGLNGPAAYPAIDPTAFWTGGMLAQYDTAVAGMSADGRSVTYTFAGAPDIPGACGADYKAVVAESGSAVAVALQAIPHATPGERIACPAIAQERTITVTLTSPLGGRVFVNAEGHAVAVCPLGLARTC